MSSLRQSPRWSALPLRLSALKPPQEEQVFSQTAWFAGQRMRNTRTEQLERWESFCLQSDSFSCGEAEKPLSITDLMISWSEVDSAFTFLLGCWFPAVHNADDLLHPGKSIGVDDTQPSAAFGFKPEKSDRDSSDSRTYKVNMSWFGLWLTQWHWGCSLSLPPGCSSSQRI